MTFVSSNNLLVERKRKEREGERERTEINQKDDFFWSLVDRCTLTKSNLSQALRAKKRTESEATESERYAKHNGALSHHYPPSGWWFGVDIGHPEDAAHGYDHSAG